MKSGCAGLSFALLLLQQPAIDKLKEQVFIGQVYPSGNVYVKSFTANHAWPKEPSLVPLVNDGASSKAALVSETMQPAYIPSSWRVPGPRRALKNNERRRRSNN